MSRPSTPVRNVQVGNALFNASVRALDVTYSEDSHEQAVLTVVSPSKADDYQYLKGQRIHFQWGEQNALAEFTGYVSDVTYVDELTSADVPRQRITCLGATMPMKFGQPRFWVNTTAAEAIASICQEHQLGFQDTQPEHSPYVWRTLAQTSESDWEMLQNLAKRIGGHLHTYQGVVRLYEREQMYQRFQPVRSLARQYTNIKQDQINLLDFVPAAVSGRIPSYQQPAVGYPAGVQAGVRPAPGDPRIPSKFASDMPARSAAEARVVQDGYYRSDWAETAEAVIDADPTLMPTMNVTVRTNLHPSAAPTYDGVWLIREATHSITMTQFTTTLSLMRSGAQDHVPAPAQPFWARAPRGKPALFSGGPGGDLWISTWR